MSVMPLLENEQIWCITETGEGGHIIKSVLHVSRVPLSLVDSNYMPPIVEMHLGQC